MARSSTLALAPRASRASTGAAPAGSPLFWMVSRACSTWASSPDSRDFCSPGRSSFDFGALAPALAAAGLPGALFGGAAAAPGATPDSAKAAPMIRIRGFLPDIVGSVRKYAPLITGPAHETQGAGAAAPASQHPPRSDRRPIAEGCERLS